MERNVILQCLAGIYLIGVATCIFMLCFYGDDSKNGNAGVGIGLFSILWPIWLVFYLVSAAYTGSWSLGY